MKAKFIQTRFFKKTAAIVFCTTAFCLNLSAQKTAVKEISRDSIEIKVYQQGIAMEDFGTAIGAVHHLLAADPVKFGSWRDTLGLLYVQTQAYPQAYLICDELLNTKGYTELRMSIKAVCAKRLQQPVEAINAYTTLFSKTGKTSYGFEQLQLEYAIRRLNESLITGNKLLQSIPSNDSTIVTVAKLDGKSSQPVTLRAAVVNIMGLAYMDIKDKSSAIASFELALKDSPDFEQAKNNLQVVNALPDENKKP